MELIIIGVLVLALCSIFSYAGSRALTVIEKFNERNN